MEKRAIRQMGAWLKSNSLDSGEFKNKWIEAYEYAHRLAEQEEKDNQEKENELHSLRHRVSMYAHEIEELRKEVKTTVPASLVEDVDKKLCDMANEATSLDDTHRICRSLTLEAARAEVRDILSRYQPAESLAELAERKGFEGIQIFASRDNMGWAINLIINGVERTISAYEMIYHESERKAREYLNGLPDKGEK